MYQDIFMICFFFCTMVFKLLMTYALICPTCYIQQTLNICGKFPVLTLNKTELCICSPNLWSRNSYLLFLSSVFSIDTVRKGKKYTFHTSASISLHFIQTIQHTMLTKLSYLLPVTKQVSDNDGNKCPNSLCNEMLLKFIDYNKPI